MGMVDPLHVHTRHGTPTAPVDIRLRLYHLQVLKALCLSTDHHGQANCVKGTLGEARDNTTHSGEAVHPAADHLFVANDDKLNKLNDEDASHFHTLVAKMSFVSTSCALERARTDIQQAVAFLTTRVSSPDTDDCEKLGRVMRHLRMCPDLPLTLEADGTNIMKWWTDASFAVHPDMRSQTGVTMTMGEGSVCSSSMKQKLNTTSSTEAELVGVSGAMLMMLWTRRFLEAQGHEANETVSHQDDQSAMLLEKNGRKSSGKRRRHINIRCFFITDRIKSGEMMVKCCPTESMAADFFTKPLQGAKFRMFRRLIVNLQDDALPEEMKSD